MTPRHNSLEHKKEVTEVPEGIYPPMDSDASDDDDDAPQTMMYPRNNSLSNGPTSRSSSPHPANGGSPHESQRRLSLLSTTTGSSDPYGSSYSMTSDPTNIQQIIQHRSYDENERESGDGDISEYYYVKDRSNIDAIYDKDKIRHYKVEEYLLPQATAETLVSNMEKRVAEVLEHSRFLQRHCGFDVPRFSHTDVEVGDPIARGGFAVIMEIKWFTTGCELNEDENEDNEYVLKHLNPKLVAKFLEDSDNDKVFAGAKDLVLEAHILSALNHNNIIALRGLSTHGIHGYKATGGRADGFFMVLDRLTTTLSKRIFNEWKSKAEENPTITKLENLTTNTAVMDFFVDRIRTALDIVSALTYLHDHQIMHRDIKPANIGFDIKGVLKVFDFGLAVEVPYSDRPNQLYDLSGNTGTPRFMAPEVMKRKAYGKRADVYSFTILFWEMMALEKPYHGLDGDAVRETVAIRAERPYIPEQWPENIAKLFKRGWAKKSDHRPSMKEMLECLTHLLQSPLQPMPLPSKHANTLHLPGKKMFRARRSMDNSSIAGK